MIKYIICCVDTILKQLCLQGYTLCSDSTTFCKTDWKILHSANGWWPKVKKQPRLQALLWIKVVKIWAWTKSNNKKTNFHRMYFCFQIAVALLIIISDFYSQIHNLLDEEIFFVDLLLYTTTLALHSTSQHMTEVQTLQLSLALIQEVFIKSFLYTVCHFQRLKSSWTLAVPSLISCQMKI